MKRSLFACALGVIVPAIFAVGCGGSDSNQPPPNAVNQPPPGTTGYPPPGTTGYPPPGNTGYPPPANTGYPPPANTGAPPPAAPPPGGATGTAQPLDANLAGPAAAALGVYARTEAPGMAADGPAIAGNFQEGQTLETAFTFQPGKCYTLVAAGVGPQVELEMQYTTVIPGLNPSIGKSSTAATQASMGGKNNCLKPLSPFPAPAKFILRAKKGAGLAAAQLYSK